MTNSSMQKNLRQKLAEKSWIVSLLVAIIGLISLSTPFSSDKAYLWPHGELGYSFDQWWFGLNVVFMVGTGYDIRWTGNPQFLIPELISFIIVVSSYVAILIIALKLRKKEKNYAKGLILGAIGISISSIILLLSLDILMMIKFGVSYWSLTGPTPGFVVIWPFIGSILVLLGYFLGKNRNTKPTME